MIKSKKLLLVTLPYFFSTAVFASTPQEQEATILTQLKTAINNQAFDTAWATASQYEDEYLGEPKFDFLYGVAALANNQAEKAVFAFERVVANEPQWLDAHYFLAKANYKIANYQAAISSSNLLVANPNTPAPLTQSAESLIDLSHTQLEKQSLYTSHQITLDIGGDSNINSGTSEDNIYLPFLDYDVPLSEASKENSDNYAALSYRFSGSKSLSQRSKILFNGQAKAQKFNNESDYDRVLGHIAIKYQRTFDFARMSAGINITPLWLNSEFYRTRNAFTLGLEKQLAQKWSLTSQLSIGKSKNKITDNLSTHDVSANLYAHYYTGNVKHSFGASYSDEESELSEHNHNSRQIKMYSYSTMWLINNNWSTATNVAFQQTNYDDIHPFFLVQREEDMWLGSASVQYSASKAWSYKLSANMQNKNSNISLFSYQRSDISLTAMFNF